MKTCSDCKTERPFSDFSKRKASKDGFQFRCKYCCKKYRKDNVEHIKNYRKENKERQKETHRRWRKENKDYLNQYYSQWREQNKDYLKTYREGYKERRRSIERERRNSEPLYKMGVYLRNRTLSAFKSKRWNKNNKTQHILGADYETIFNHIQSRFKGGMSWDNFGEWQIDHIIPLASANTEEELIGLCHYTNLQPLWAEENLIKGNKIIACRINLNQ